MTSNKRNIKVLRPLRSDLLIGRIELQFDLLVQALDVHLGLSCVEHVQGYLRGLLQNLLLLNDLLRGRLDLSDWQSGVFESLFLQSCSNLRSVI